MKIVSLLGSPRKNGNSAAIARHVCTTAEAMGAEVTTFALNELNFRACQSCMACKTTLERCALKDDLTAVLDAIREADVLVLASPVYFWDVSAQLKAFLDRTYSFLVPDFHNQAVKSRLAPGKKLIMVLTQGNPDESLFANIFPKFDHFFTMQGFSETHLIRACGVREPGEVVSREAVMQLAEQTARAVCVR